LRRSLCRRRSGLRLGGLLLKLDGTWGLAGWQWLFVVEAVPTIIVGLLLLVWLTDRPADATWLTQEQKSRLASTPTS